MNADKKTLYEKLDWAVDRWCERRALSPLRILLPVYHPGVALVHTDQFHDLLEGLRDVKGLCRQQLDSEELSYVIESINEIEDALNRQVKS
jgi:hypothetical protein